MKSTLGRFLCVLTLLLSLSGCSKREIPSDAPKPVLTAWVTAKGKSMIPTFPESALVEVEIGVPFSALKEGDTVVFWNYSGGPATFIHHRLVQKQAGNWIAQGDNSATNPTADRPWVTPDNFIGRTTGRYARLVTPDSFVK